MAYNLPDINFINGIKEDIKRQINDKINEVKFWVESAKNAVENAKNSVVRQITDTVGALYYSLEIKFNYVKDTIVNNISSLIYSIKHEITNRIQDAKNFISDTYWYLRGKIGELKEDIKGIYNNVKNTVVSEFNNYKNILSNTLTITKNSIENKIHDIENKITRFVKDTYNNVKDEIANRISSVKTSLENTFNNVKNSIETKVVELKNTFTTTIENVKNALTNGYEQFKAEVKAKYDIVKNALENGLEQAKREVKALQERVTTGLKKAQETITGKIDSITKTIRDEINKAIKTVTDLLTNILVVTVEQLTPSLMELNLIMRKITSNQYNDYDDILADLDKMGSKETVIDILVKVGLTLSFITTAIPMLAQPFTENLVNLVNAKAQSSLLTPPVITNMIFRAFDNGLDYDAEFRKLGFSAKRQEAMIENQRPLLEPFQIQTSYLRGDVGEVTHDTNLAKHGYKDEQIELIKKLYNIIPPVSDLITMSVREVFSPDIAEKFGQFEDFPVEFAKFAKMQGLSEQWSKNYWAAHWGLPSATQGFEMLHRRAIDNDTLKLLLRSLDVMPFWRDKLIKISYNPYTRVDIRRMHKVGVLDEKGVYEAHLDIGYDEDRAKKLTEFTLLLNSADVIADVSKLRKVIIDTLTEAYVFELISKEEAASRLTLIGLTFDEIEFTLGFNSTNKIIKNIIKVNQAVEKKYSKIVYESYTRRAITKEEAVEDLLKFGIDEIDIVSELEIIDYDIERNIKDKMIASVQELYTEWTIDKPKMYSLLSDFGFSDGEITQTLKELDIFREMRTKKPTLKEFTTWLKNGLISMDRFILELKGLGYADTYIELYKDSLEFYEEQ